MDDPVVAANTGIDPATGSYLSSEKRKEIFRRSRVSGFTGNGGGALVVRPQESLIDKTQTLRIQTTEQNIQGLQKELKIINVSVTELNQRLLNIGNLIQADTALDQKQYTQEQQNERLLTERKIRTGQESQLEQNIISALATPIVKIQQKVNGLFENIMGALKTLFFGWLTNEAIETLKALAIGDKKKLEEIKKNVIKNVAYAVGAFAAINLGFGLIMRTITGLTFKVAGLAAKIITSPLKLASTAAASALGLSSLKPPSGPPKESGNLFTKGLKFAGKAFTAIAGITDLFKGEYVDAALSVGALKGPGISKLAFGTALALDTGFELMGSNLFGKNPNEPNKETSNSKKESPKVAPQSPKLENNNKKQPENLTANKPTENKNQISKDENAINNAAQSIISQPQTPMIPPPSEDMIKKYEMAWQYRNNPMARGKIESTWEQMSSEQKMQAKSWAESKGYNWGEMKLKEPEVAIQAPPKSEVMLNSLPEPSPNIIMADGGTDRSQVSSPQQESLTDVPLIPSANPDNFYVLYSQLNYNVVM